LFGCSGILSHRHAAGFELRISRGASRTGTTGGLAHDDADGDRGADRCIERYAAAGKQRRRWDEVCAAQRHARPKADGDTEEDAVNQGFREPSYIVTVSEFAQRLRSVFSRVSAFGYIAVRGEASEVRSTPYGMYFTLKDANAVLSCFVKPYVEKKLPKIEQGMALTAYGSVQVVDRRSQYQLVVDRVDLSGVG